MLQPERRASRAAHFVSILKAPPLIVVLEESQAEDSRLPSGDKALEDSKGAVSYTHLTLPTILLV